MKRLFFALWPGDDVRRRCAEIGRSVSESGEKRVRPENLHVTLAFLGSVNVETEAGVLLAATLITPPVLTIAFDRLSYWRKPRILCLSGHSDGTVLEALVGRLNEISLQCGIPVDDRPYTPHVTLVRKAKAPRKIAFDPILWQSDSFCLVESCSGPEGVEYRVIKEWKSNPKENDQAHSADD